MKLKNSLLKINAFLGKVEELILGVIVVLMAVLLIYNVFARFVLNSSLQFAEELGIVLLVAICYIGSITAVRKSKHIRMVLLSDMLPPRGAYLLTILNSLLAAAAFIFFGVLSAKFMLTVYASGRLFMTFQFPRWVIWLPVVIGLFATGFQYLLVFFYNIVDRKNMAGKDEMWIGSERKFGESEA